MSTVTTAPPLAMTDEQRAALEKVARSTTLGHRKVIQAKALLLAADGVGTNEVARLCHTSNESVRAWRRRFEAQGVEGVGRIAKGRGRRSWLPEGTVSRVVHDTLHELPDDGSTHWTTRLMAKRFGIGKDTVARIWKDHNLKPWKLETFKISATPISKRSWSTWSGSTWTLQNGRSCSVSTKRPRCKRSIAPSRRCRSSRAEAAP